MSLFRSPQPVVPVRGLHLDLKGVPPTPRRLLELLKIAAAARYNALLVEWEDMFPWTVDERFRCETAYCEADVRSFADQAGRLGLEIIPLVQCLGHMETPLSVRGYEHLRELPHLSNCLNPLAPGARQLVEAMIDDVLRLLPDVKRFHLGGDEAWSFGQHPDTKAYVERHGKGALYLHHVEPILDKLSALGIRPILWSDMMSHWESPEALRAIGKKADLCPWGYDGHPDQWDYHSRSEVIQRFKDHGIPLWGATCYKNGSGHSAELPDAQARQINALAWAEVTPRFGLKGLFATAWSRFNTHQMQCVPIDAALDCLVLVGVCLHDGQAPQGGLEACKGLLEELGERPRLETCVAAMKELAGVRHYGWREIQNLREQIYVGTMDCRRRGSGQACEFLRHLRRHMRAGGDTAAAKFRRAFAGLLDEIWIDRYLGERLEPLWEELGSLDARVRVLEPDAYTAMFGQAGAWNTVAPELPLKTP
jgi:hexosaminidase